MGGGGVRGKREGTCAKTMACPRCSRYSPTTTFSSSAARADCTAWKPIRFPCPLGAGKGPRSPKSSQESTALQFGPSAPPGALWRRVPGARAGLHHGDEERNHQEDPVFWLQGEYDRIVLVRILATTSRCVS